MRNLFKKISNRLQRIFKYRFINPLIKLSCKRNIPYHIYTSLFFIESEKRKILKIKKHKSYFILNELSDDITINWSFPFKYRSRSRSNYKYGLETRGYDLALSYNLDQLVFENNDIVIDCGANYGDLWLYFRFLEKSINYIAIEPGKDELKTLKRNIKDLNNSNINSEIHNFALGNENKETIFYYAPQDADSSIIKPNIFSSTYKVKVKTLDTFFKEKSFNKKKIKLLKLEAEGFEPEIIIGGKNAIKNIEYIAADLGPERGFEQKVTLPDVTNFLLKNNFKIKSISNKRLTVLFENTKVKIE